MADRADAHIHLFSGGFPGSFTGRDGLTVDEAALYQSLALDHEVRAALIVGYAALSWCRGNTTYLAGQAVSHDWVRPAAYFDLAAPPTVAELERLRAQNFVGIVFYLTRETAPRLATVEDEVWDWLVAHRWLVSCNAAGAAWAGWLPVLERHGELRLVCSHLGSPPAVETPPSREQTRRDLAVLPFAEFPGPRVKLSGFYAATKPGWDYPHEAAWPYVETLLETFGVERLVWGSDFSPALDRLSFPQTYGLFARMPFLDHAMREMIEGGNLLQLLAAAAGG